MLTRLFDAAATPWRRNFEDESVNDMTNGLSDDLLLEILVRVPDSSSAIRCGAVCKRWNNLTAKNPLFIETFIHHRHRRASADRHMACFLLQKSSILNSNKIFSLRSKKLDRDLIEKSNFLEFGSDGTGFIRASFEDLLLVSVSWATDYVIFNTITKRWVRLPPGPRRESRTATHGLICRRLSSTSIIYRVVLFYYVNITRIPVYVFSSETLKWATSTLEHRLVPIGSSNMPEPDYSLVTSKGIMYLNHPFGHGSIIAFDPFGKEPKKRMRSRAVALPEEIMDNGMVISLYYPADLCLGVCRGQLRVCQMMFDRVNDCGLRLQAWELKEDRSWSLVHRAEFCIRDSVRQLRVAKFHPNDPDVVFLNDQSCVYICHFPEKKLVKIVKFADCDGTERNGRLTLISNVPPYWPTPVPSLELPN